MTTSLMVSRAVEERAQIESLETLHAERRTLLVQLAPLKALHGHNGLWDDKRKQYLEARKIESRRALLETGNKPTEAMVDAMAYGSEQYESFLDAGVTARIEYIRLANELSEIEERIRSREIELLAYNSEIRLAR